MSNEMVKHKSNEVLKLDDLTLSKEEIKRHFTPGASDDELAVFIMTAQSWGLNPIKKEIMFVKYGSNPGACVINYQVPIKRAEASGELQGYTVDYKGQGDNAVCTVTIHRKGWKTPFIHETVFREVAYGYSKAKGRYLKSGQWGTNGQPTFMHKKTTINQAFKLAFPSLLGNMPYIEGEVPLEGGTVEAEYEVVKDPIGGKDRISAVDDSDLPWQDGKTALDDLELFIQGHYAHDRGAAKDMLKRCFGTSAWTKITKLADDDIRAGYEEMKRLIDGVNEPVEAGPEREEKAEKETLLHTESGEDNPSHKDASPDHKAVLAKIDKRLKNMKHYADDVRDVAGWAGYDLKVDPANVQGNIDKLEWKVAMLGIRGWYELRDF